MRGSPDTCVGGSRTSSLQGACHLRGSPVKWSVLPLRFHGENRQHRRFSHEMAAAERGSAGTGWLAGDRMRHRVRRRRPPRPGEVNCPRSGRNPPRSTCLAFDTTGGRGQMALGTPWRRIPPTHQPGSRAAPTPFRSPPGSRSMTAQKPSRGTACARQRAQITHTSVRRARYPVKWSLLSS
jgi:hypothetical protein